jgi:cysteine desulfurase
VQAAGKIDIDVKDLGVDLLTISAHKFYGPKGISALYIKKGLEINSWLHGGKQEKELRASTENIPAIIGFAKAVTLMTQQDIKSITKLRNYSSHK